MHTFDFQYVQNHNMNLGKELPVGLKTEENFSSNIKYLINIYGGSMKIAEVYDLFYRESEKWREAYKNVKS